MVIIKQFLTISLLVIICLNIKSQSNFRLVATMDDFHRLENSGLTHIWGYSFYTPPTYHASLPAPLLEINTGDSINIFFYNDSPENHTIHLHGLDVEQSMDGVPTTSFSVPFQDSTNYSFIAPHPGTYLYHCHVLTTLHLAMGMYGMIIVNDTSANKFYSNGPSYNKSYPLLSSDMFQQWNDNPLSPGPLHKYYADQFLINGKSGIQLFEDTSQVIDALPGDSIRFNIGNIGYNRVTYKFPSELNVEILMSDGRKLPSSISSDSIVLYPGERYTAISTPTSYFEGYIEVDYYNLKSKQNDGTNLIGVNRYNHPNSLNELSDLNIQIYPNPTSEFIFIEPYVKGNYKITDINGRIIKLGKTESNPIDVSSLKRGIYLFMIDNKNAIKFIKY